MSSQGPAGLPLRFARWMRRPLARFRPPAPGPPETPELQLVWPAARLDSPPAWQVPKGYRLRVYRAEDQAGYFRLMERAGYPGWTADGLASWLNRVVPDGILLLTEAASGALAATAMGVHNPSPLHPFGGTLSCVAADPDYHGHGLGRVVSAAVTERLLRGGYTDIYLQTDDWRLAAIKTYLRLGWVPFLFQDDMPERWEAVCARLAWPFTPADWPAPEAGGHAAA